MTEFLIYQGKAAVILAVFYMFYRLLLSKDTFHRFNRIILLGTAVLSFVLPLCVITIHEVVVIPTVQSTPQMTESATIGTMTTIAEVSEPIWPYVLCVIFALGAFGVLVMTIISITKVIGIIAGGEHRTLERGETLVITDAETAPFSWMKYIVLSREDYESGYSQILTHEKAHIALRHSWDILFVDMITALQWFNPAIWMLKADLRAIHEFEADDAVLRSGADAKEYQYLLIRKAVSKSGYSVANSFNHSTLKARITMMLSKKSSRMSAWKALYVLPLVGISLAATAETKVDYRYEDQQPVAVADTLKDKGSENWYKVEHKDGVSAKTDFIKKNPHEGKLITDLENNTLTVISYDKDGNELRTRFKDINPNEDIYIHNGAYADESVFNKIAAEEPEAVIMVGYLRNGRKARALVTPSDAYLTGTVILRKQEEDDPVKLKARDAEGKEITVDPSKVLFVLDEKPMPEGYSMNQINPDTIESIRILKTEEAHDKYGKYAENKDVIEISTKLLRFIPVSEPVGNLEEYDRYKLYNATEYFKTINYEEYLKIPKESLAYLFVENTTKGTKTLHVYTTDYDMETHLSKCRSTTDIHDDNLSWINENTRIIIDGKQENYEGYLRTLKFQSDNIATIEYHKYSRSNMKHKKRICNGYVNVIYKDDYTGPKVTIYTTMRRDWHYAYHLTD